MHAGADVVDAALKSLGLRQPGLCPTCCASTKLLGSVCRFCRDRFCLAHAQAEVHGCGDAAHKAGRSAARKEVSTGAPSKAPKAQQSKARGLCL